MWEGLYIEILGQGCGAWGDGWGGGIDSKSGAVGGDGFVVGRL